MVRSIQFQPTLINTEVGEAYTWIELRNQVEQNLTTKKLFDEWDKKTVFQLISPFVSSSTKSAKGKYMEALEIVFEEIRDNDTVIAVEDECTQEIILALVEFLFQESYGK